MFLIGLRNRDGFSWPDRPGFPATNPIQQITRP
jgi:hypothetical protein